MTESHYSMLVLWSEDDEAFLVHVGELPGCIAHGETREEAVQNARIAIENWIDTAKEIKRKVPKPFDLAAFEKQTKHQAELVQQAIDKVVQQMVQMVSFCPGNLRGVGAVSASAEDLEAQRMSR